MNKILKIFNHFILQTKIPNHIYNSKSLKDDIEKLFNSDLVLKNKKDPIERCGKSDTTCGLGNDVILNLTDFNLILDYISKIILKNNFIENGNNLKVLYTRIWANKAYKNSCGKSHVHNGINDGTAVFYYEVPDNSSNLIILKENIGDVVTEEHNNISQVIKVKTGDLIIHEKNVPHAISKHMTDEPRICFVFDFKLVK